MEFTGVRGNGSRVRVRFDHTRDHVHLIASGRLDVPKPDAPAARPPVKEPSANRTSLAAIVVDVLGWFGPEK